MGEKPQVPPAIMLRQLAHVMRASRALYAAAELGIADILAAGPMTTDVNRNEFARGAAGLDLRERGTVAARQKAAKERRIWDPKKMPSSTFPRIAYDFSGAQAKCCCLAQRP